MRLSVPRPRLEKLALRMAWVLFRVRDAKLARRVPALFEDAQNIAWLADGKLRQWFEERQNAVQPRLFRRDRFGIEKG